jgi:predicted nucleotidyltransferase
MQDILARRLDEIATLCREHHVRRLDVFGSAANGAFDVARSDLDFIVSFDTALPVSGFSGYFALKEALETLLQRRVDLVTEGTVRNPYVRRGIEESRELIYAA